MHKTTEINHQHGMADGSELWVTEYVRAGHPIKQTFTVSGTNIKE